MNANTPKGYLTILLHAHLPFVRHPENDFFLEEKWLYEAITETYIPTLNIFEQFKNDNIGFRLTMSFTPTLISMLRDKLLQDRYITHLDKLIELTEKEIRRTSFDKAYNELAKSYNQRFIDTKKIFIDVYKKDLISAFKKFQDSGNLEIITSCATHGFLPVLEVNPTSIRSQIKIGVDFYREVFGKKPTGIWLPECGYFNGLDEILSDYGIRYFFTDAHGVMNADPIPRYGIYSPIYSPSGVAVFGRDLDASKQVWSARTGYPGHPYYREYYKDIGYELEYNYIKPYINPDGVRINTSIKYWRITGPTEYKEVYNPEWAKKKVDEHSSDFIQKRKEQIRQLGLYMDRKPIIVAPYDAELFGHWWYEGPQWIDSLVRKIKDEKEIALATPMDYLDEYKTNQMSMPASSSWGYKGYNEYWVNETNDWIYRHIHKAGKRMLLLTYRFEKELHNKKNTLIKRALNQAARELLLAEASDWAFIMRTKTTVKYATKRIENHILRFTKLYEDLNKGAIDEAWLKDVEEKDNIFSHMDCAEYYSL